MRKITDDALKRDGHSTSRIESSITALSSDNAEIRREARDFLVAKGEEALPYLISELSSPKEHNRWEAAKALAVIKHIGATEALVTSLRDRSEDVRWVAGEALISIGEKSLEPLLRELTFRYNSVEFRTGAMHVLHALSGITLYDTIRPVLTALQRNIMSYDLPVAAYQAWMTLKLSQPMVESV